MLWRRSVLSISTTWTVLMGLLVSLITGATLAVAAPDAALRTQHTQFVGFEIPFEYEVPERPHIAVRAKINDSEPMLFLLDTGSDLSLIVFPWVTKQLGLKPTGKQLNVNAGEAKVSILEPARLAIPDRDLDIALQSRLPQVFEMQPPAYVAAYAPVKVAGIIGAPFLMTVSSRFDFDTKTWTVLGRAAAAPPSDGRKVWQVPLTRTSTNPSVSVRSVKVTVSDSTGKPQADFDLLFDTGGRGIVLPGTTSTKIAGLPRARSEGRRFNIGGVEASQGFLFPLLQIGNASTTNADVTLSPSATKATLGLNVLERFRITLSPADNKVYLEERPGFKPHLLGDTGILLNLVEGRGDGYFIATTNNVVIKGGDGTGGDTSLRVGDRLLSIDGRTIAKMPEWLLSYLLNTPEGTPAKLEAQTGSKPPRIVLVERRSRYTATGKNVEK